MYFSQKAKVTFFLLEKWHFEVAAEIWRQTQWFLWETCRIKGRKAANECFAHTWYS